MATLELQLTLLTMLVNLHQAFATNNDWEALAALYEATGGASWQPADDRREPCNFGWLQNEPCNGTMSKWTSVSCNSEGRVERLALSKCGLNGSLPTEFGLLTTMISADLHGNSLSGSLPTQLSRLTNLEKLDLYRNDFTYPSSLEDDRKALYFVATQHCRDRGVSCKGIPPDSCTAFMGADGADLRLSITDPDQCVACTDGDAAAVALVLGLSVGGVILLVVFVRLVLRHPSSYKRWVSTVAIFISHAQTIGILGSLDLSWPSPIKLFIGALRLQLFNLPQASCLLPGGAHGQMGPFQVYALVVCATSLAVLLSMLLIKAAFDCRGLHAHADSAELALSMIFSLQLTFSWGVIDRVARNILQTSLETVLETRLAVLATTIPLLLLQLALALRFTRNVLSFQRGLESGRWRSPGWFTWLPCCHGGRRGCHSSICADLPIYPRRLEKQVGYLTGRFAAHAPRWQLVIWLRQLVLVLLGFSCNALKEHLHIGVFNQVARYPIVVAAIFVTLGFWRAHHCSEPYAFDFQNAIESWLYGATVLLLTLASIYSGLVESNDDPLADGAVRTAVEVAMLAVLSGSLLSTAILAVRRVHLMRRALAEVNVSAALLAIADKPIDGKLSERLGDGSIRLLRCDWLLSEDSDASLGRDPATGNAVMRRQQELPAAAFFSEQEAADLLARGDRSILALSFGWLTAAQPDPHGTTLAAIRRYLRSEPAAVARCGLFWEYDAYATEQNPDVASSRA